HGAQAFVELVVFLEQARFQRDQVSLEVEIAVERAPQAFDARSMIDEALDAGACGQQPGAGHSDEGSPPRDASQAHLAQPKIELCQYGMHRLLVAQQDGYEIVGALRGW